MENKLHTKYYVERSFYHCTALQTDEERLIFIVVVSTVVLLLLVSFIVLFLFFYQQRIYKHKQQMQSIQEAYAQEMLKAR